MFEFGEKVEKHSNSLVMKLISVGMQIDCVDRQKESELYSTLIKKHSEYSNLWSCLQEKTGRDALLKYLRFAYQHGEVNAIKALLSNKIEQAPQ